jgi:hypothetical protein
MRTRGGAVWWAVVVAAVLPWVSVIAAAAVPVVRVGIVKDGPVGDRGQALLEPLIAEVIGLGVVACSELAHRRDLPKPVIAPIVIDPRLQELPVVDGASGVHNLNYLASFKSFRRDVHLFHDIVPFRRLAVVTDGLILETVPTLLP